MKKALTAAALILAAVPSFAETAVYFARGRDISLFSAIDVDGFSVETFPESSGVRLIVRSRPDKPLGDARFLLRGGRDFHLPAAPVRDALAVSLTRGSETESTAVRMVLEWVSENILYDGDRNRPQDPGSVFSSRRAYCVGFAELTVDLLRRAGITASTVQGVLVGGPSVPDYDPAISGVYHRWVKVYYPGVGWRYLDPRGGNREVTARYVPFSRRSWTKPEDLHLTRVSENVQ